MTTTPASITAPPFTTPPVARPNAQPAQQTAPDQPLQRALDQNVAATATVMQSADALLVINTVLKQELPDDIQTGEVAQALQKTDELEVRIQDTAQDLEQVNQALSREIAERCALEQQLAATQAALHKATANVNS